jgi:hypothetical protein
MALFITGLLLVLFLWPVIGFETSDSFDINDVKKGDSVRYVGYITDITQIGEIYVLILDDGSLDAYTKEEGFKTQDKVVVTITFGENATNYDENTYLVQKIPTVGGTLGAVGIFIGLVLMVIGIATKKRTVEDVVKFTIEPAPEIPVQAQETKTGSTPVPTKPTKENVTCPGCGKVFEVSKSLETSKVTCPECGLSGRTQ